MKPTIVTGPPHNCQRDGHKIALRIKDRGAELYLAPFCEVCRRSSFPGLGLTGDPVQGAILRLVAAANDDPGVPDTPPQGLYS